MQLCQNFGISGGGLNTPNPRYTTGSSLLKTYQCTGTYHTYWILLEIYFISHTEQVWQYSLEIKMTHDCCTLYFVPCTLFLRNTQPTKGKLPLSKWSYMPEQVRKLCESLWSYLSSRGGSYLEYSYLKSEQKKFLCPLSYLMLHCW
jgi:hypothetical protein